MSYAAGVIAVIYRWRIHPGQEAAFAAAWRQVTDAIYAHCGSHGSCLHQGADSTFVAYARWPSEAARTACFAAAIPGVDVARAQMRQAIAESFPEQVLPVLDDALAVPQPR